MRTEQARLGRERHRKDMKQLLFVHLRLTCGLHEHHPVPGSHGLVPQQRNERDGVEEVFAQFVLCLLSQTASKTNPFWDERWST